MSSKVIAGLVGVLTAFALSALPVASAQDDPAAALTALLRGHVYQGLNYRKETIRKVEFAPAQGMLGITFDDAQESFPITAIVPLREIGDLQLSGNVAVLACRQPGCIALTGENFLPAVAKLAQSPDAKLVRMKRGDRVEFGFKPENARAIARTLSALVRNAKGK